MLARPGGSNCTLTIIKTFQMPTLNSASKASRPHKRRGTAIGWRCAQASPSMPAAPVATQKLPEATVCLAMWPLVDPPLAASLVPLLMMAGYEISVSRLDLEEEARHRIAWLGKLDSGSLKVKVASSIVAISSIHLLKAFMNFD